MLAGSLCLSPSESFLVSASWGSLFPPLGEVALAGGAACADWVGVVLDAWEDWTGVTEGLLSFEEWAGAAVVAKICFSGWEEADGTLGQVVLMEWLEPEVVLGERTGGFCFTGWTENVTLVGEVVLAGVGEGVIVWVGVRGESCFWMWLEAGTLAELETEGWRQGVVLWALLWEGTGVIGIGEEQGIGVTGVKVCVGVWEGVEVRVRDVWEGEGIRVGAGLGPDSKEAVWGVLDTLALGLWGCSGEEATKEEGGEEEVRDDLGP